MRVIFCGKGIDVPKIEEAAKADSRIEYFGMLTQDELFKVYEDADVLLNLRIEEEEDFHFPGKLLECLSMGKLVVSTPIAHAKRDYGRYMKVLHDVTPAGLASLMREIVSTPKSDLYEPGMEARKFMLENRIWEKRTQEIMENINRK